MIYPRIAAVAAVAILLGAGVAQGRPTVEVVECGQVVERAIGVMTHDLDCSSFDGDSLTLKRARLEMRGFTGNASSQEACDMGKAPPAACADIVKSADPGHGPLRVKFVTCGTSADRETGEPFGFRSDD